MPEEYQIPDDLFSNKSSEPLPGVNKTSKIRELTARERVLSKIPLGEDLLGASALRSYGTMLGAVGGGFLGTGAGGLGAVPGMGYGGYVGNRLVNEAQSWLPSILGQPSADPKSTAALDSAANLSGIGLSKVIGGILKALPSTVSTSSRRNLQAKLLKYFGQSPETQISANPLRPTDPMNPLGAIQELRAKGFPVTSGQATASPVLLEFEKMAKNHPEIAAKQAEMIKSMGQDLLTEGNKNISWQSKQMRELGINRGYGETANWLRRTTPIAEDIIPKGTSGEAWIRKQVSTLDDFTKFTQMVGPEKSKYVLIKDMLEKSLEKEGVFDANKMFNIYKEKRDLFNLAAKNSEKSGGAKASDLKASWNRFMYANLLRNRGTQVSTRGMEIAAAQGGVSGGAGLILLGADSYPAVRVAASLVKYTLVGPAVGKAFSNPEIVDQLTKLMVNKAGHPANVPTFKRIVAWAWKNGISFKTTEGMDVTINPKTLKPSPVNNSQTEESTEIPDNLFN